ncbi:MAG: low molecular weight phosphotyrosine protein phosphatase [Gammaproteobacteria bacterium]|nr:low molecular weight phosphotyrosine protein phosphatase [Gammaproteobacteria bacterium]
MSTDERVSVLFVCLGNICRSPTAQGVFEHLVSTEGLTQRISADSAGTHAYHVGEQPDRRSQQAALRRGIDLSSQRARRVASEDFEQYHYILAMDKENYRNLMAVCPPQHHAKVRMFLSFADVQSVQEVPDPYYGGDNGFEQVLDLVEAASRGLLAHLRQHHL